MEISAVPLREPASTPSGVYARAIQTFNNGEGEKKSARCASSAKRRVECLKNKESGKDEVSTFNF